MFQLIPQAPPAFNPELVHEGIVLRAPRQSDFDVWRAVREESRAHLTIWEDQWPDHALTMRSFRRRLDIWEKQRRNGTGLSLFAFEAASQALVGGLTLTQIRYGAANAGVVGYWIGSRHTRKGFGTKAVTAMLDHGFDRIGLNRIEAACQPENTASARLLAGCGFRLEGRARDYLRINGAWCDHDIYAVTARDRRPVV